MKKLLLSGCMMFAVALNAKDQSSDNALASAPKPALSEADLKFMRDYEEEGFKRDRNACAASFVLTLVGTHLFGPCKGWGVKNVGLQVCCAMLGGVVGGKSLRDGWNSIGDGKQLLERYQALCAVRNTQRAAHNAQVAAANSDKALVAAQEAFVKAQQQVAAKTPAAAASAPKGS